MLVLSRKKNEQLVIRMGEETVLVRVLDVNGSRVRIGITAPRSVAVLREEVARRIQESQPVFDEVQADAAPPS